MSVWSRKPDTWHPDWCAPHRCSVNKELRGPQSEHRSEPLGRNHPWGRSVTSRVHRIADGQSFLELTVRVRLSPDGVQALVQAEAIIPSFDRLMKTLMLDPRAVQALPARRAA